MAVRSNGSSKKKQAKPASGVSTTWGGRFKESMNALLVDFNESISFDYRLAGVDIQGSLAHAAMLQKQGYLTAKDLAAIRKGMAQVLSEIKSGKLPWSKRLEDVHMNVETRLTELIGAPGKKLHTGRSRNDQVSTDFRAYLVQEIGAIQEQIRTAQQTLVALAERHSKLVIPGFTHLQNAMPIPAASWALAYVEMLDRDKGRFQAALLSAKSLPLGAGALAGTTLRTDRKKLLAEMPQFFDRLSRNSLDAVSDRDFALEFLFAASTLMMHLSRFSEDLIVFATSYFDLVEIGDAFCTGSSLMPQKKNPDVPELLRGKTGRVYGHLMGLLTVLKGLPLAYNKDMQEDKEPVFDTVATVRRALDIVAGMVATMRFKEAEAAKALEKGYLDATALSDYLVEKGLPFRETHHLVGKLVAVAIAAKKPLAALSLSALNEGLAKPYFSKDIYQLLGAKNCAWKYTFAKEIGGEVKAWKKFLADRKKSLQVRR